MDGVLCDELLQEIFTRLPPSTTNTTATATSSSISLVSKRWLNLYRSSKTSLSLRLNISTISIPSLSSFLSHYPYLSTLSLLLLSTGNHTLTTADQLLFVASSSFPNLKTLKVSPLPVSASALFSLSKTCNQITSLTVSLSRNDLHFNWVCLFSSLKALSLYICDFSATLAPGLCLNIETDDDDIELGLESLCLNGIGLDDCGVGSLWSRCRNVKNLKLTSCESLGDGGSFSSFINCLQGLEELELRTCRTIVDGVMLKLTDNAINLRSLLVYDGGNRDSILHFINNCPCDLQKLDLRLPLDLDNEHLIAIGLNFPNLTTFRLQSSCLVTGDGLKSLGIAMNSGLRELALINCDVVERESGLLATLGQYFKHLRTLDLSYNEMLVDKEFISMIVSCNCLTELKIRGCKRLSNMAAISIFKSCKNLELIDIMYCSGIEVDAVETLVLNSRQLRQLKVEDSKISDYARKWASRKWIEVVT
ncbi:hypothetical protein ACFE04_007829 [Oxalis oulophora]